jgi:hypothetical protein
MAAVEDDDDNDAVSTEAMVVASKPRKACKLLIPNDPIQYAVQVVRLKTFARTGVSLATGEDAVEKLRAISYL